MKENVPSGTELEHKAANAWSDKNWDDHAWKVKKEAFLAGVEWQRSQTCHVSSHPGYCTVPGHVNEVLEPTKASSSAHACHACTRRQMHSAPWKRFWEKVDRNGPTIVETPCWVWTGAIHGSGYGNFWLEDEQTVSAHRFAYELVHGQIPDNRLLMHRCDNPVCVNPAHLAPGTDADNMGDASAKGRIGHSNRYSKETRSEAIAAIRSGEKRASISKRMGMSTRVLRRWVQLEHAEDDRA